MSQKLKQLVAASLFALSALTTTQAHAVGQLAELTITDRGTGAVLPVYYHRGEYWVAGRPGAKYAITLCNRVGERLLGVASVDGINVLSGDTAAWGQSGYVFAGRSCHSITGWRKSDSEVAAFEFSASSDSYAGLTGRPNQVGVIGIAVFRERIPEPVRVPPAVFERGEPDRFGAAKEARTDRAQGGAPAPAAPAATALAEQKAAGEVRDTAQRSSAAAPLPVMPKLGTAHGQREESYVSHTEFERAQHRPNEVIRIRYDSREALLVLGVIQEAPLRHPSPLPNPFPLSANTSYVPDPPAPRY